eukprot:364040-Chlamydomonas_euryale.AAC.3
MPGCGAGLFFTPFPHRKAASLSSRFHRLSRCCRAGAGEESRIVHGGQTLRGAVAGSSPGKGGGGVLGGEPQRDDPVPRPPSRPPCYLRQATASRFPPSARADSRRRHAAPRRAAAKGTLSRARRGRTHTRAAGAAQLSHQHGDRKVDRLGKCMPCNPANSSHHTAVTILTQSSWLQTALRVQGYFEGCVLAMRA